MGEIAEMMLDGTLCAGCGEFLSETPAGYPVYCDGCKEPERAVAKTAKVKCPECGRMVKEAGLHDHKRDKHGQKS